MLINGNEVNINEIRDIKLSAWIEKSYIKDAEERMEKLTASWDTEDAHAKADEILTDVLATLGFVELVSIYNKVPKWYA